MRTKPIYQDRNVSNEVIEAARALEINGQSTGEVRALAGLIITAMEEINNNLAKVVFDLRQPKQFCSNIARKNFGTHKTKTARMKPYIVRELLEDADYFGYIRQGALADVYDGISADINANLSKDLSIKQISKIIWKAFYQELCVNPTFSLTEKEAKYILGEPDSFLSIAGQIRKALEY